MLAKVYTAAVVGLDGDRSLPKSKVETSIVEVDGGLQEIKSQEHAKRALEVAAAGGHNVLMVGSITRVHFAYQLKPPFRSCSMN